MDFVKNDCFIRGGFISELSASPVELKMYYTPVNFSLVSPHSVFSTPKTRPPNGSRGVPKAA